MYYEVDVLHFVERLAMSFPWLVSVTPLTGKVQNIFSLIMTRTLHSYILHELGMKEKGTYSTPKDSISNLDVISSLVSF